jgi:hypothetical protein
MLASACGHAEIVKMLLEANPGAIDMQDNEGSTALFHACRTGREQVVKLLKSFGADLSLSNKAGQLAADVCRGFGHKGLARIVEAGGRRRSSLQLQQQGQERRPSVSGTGEARPRRRSSGGTELAGVAAEARRPSVGEARRPSIGGAPEGSRRPSVDDVRRTSVSGAVGAARRPSVGSEARRAAAGGAEAKGDERRRSVSGKEGEAKKAAHAAGEVEAKDAGPRWR